MIETSKQFRKIGLTAVLAMSLLSGRAVSAQDFIPETDAVQKIIDYEREVWQLIYINDSVWAEIDPKNTKLSKDIKHSIVAQFKLVTWSIAGEVDKMAFWLDCNMPILEHRKRVITPAHTIEQRDENGDVSYRTKPAEYKSYLDIIRTQEGCSLLPPAENISSSAVELSFAQLFNKARRVKYGDALVYIDVEGTSLANFKLASGF